jgi:hypothetical protein
MMKQVTTAGLICLRDDLDIEYKISKITYTERIDGTFVYVFEPYYTVIDLLTPPVFQGIPGIDLDLRKPEYVRENIVPVFISERTPGRNRENLWELLDKVGMKYLNQLEWLIRTNTRYFGDHLYTKRFTNNDEKHVVSIDSSQKPERARNKCKRILSTICYGHDIESNGYSIDDSNRKAFYSLLISLYGSELAYVRNRHLEGVRKSAAAGNYRGRKRIEIDDPKAYEIFKGFHSGKFTEKEALQKLGISRSTFYRRMKEFRNIGLLE